MLRTPVTPPRSVPRGRGSRSARALGLPKELGAIDAGYFEITEAMEMPHLHTLTTIIAGAAMAIWIGWIVVVGGAEVDSAEAYGQTTSQAIALAGATIIPTDRKLTVEPAGYRIVVKVVRNDVGSIGLNPSLGIR